MFSFGISREAYDKVYIKAQPVKDSAIPGPGTYDLPTTLGKNARKVAFRPMTSDPSNRFLTINS